VSGQVSKSQASVSWSLSLDPLGLLVNGSCKLALRSSIIFQMPSAKPSGAPDKASCLGVLTSMLAMCFEYKASVTNGLQAIQCKLACKLTFSYRLCEQKNEKGWQVRLTSSLS
jgi:hypothetical protein